MPLRQWLQTHAVDTLAENEWSKLDNGELLDRAEKYGSEIVVTTDKNLEHQQNLKNRSIGVVVLPSANWPNIHKCVRNVDQAIRDASPGKFIDVQIPTK